MSTGENGVEDLRDDEADDCDGSLVDEHGAEAVETEAVGRLVAAVEALHLAVFSQISNLLEQS